MPVVTLSKTTAVMADTHVISSSLDINYSAITTISLGVHNSASDVYRAIIKLDLGLVPNESDVSSALLNLTQMSYLSSTAKTFTVHKITSAFDPTTVAWNNQPTFGANPYASFAVSGSSTTVFTADITQLIQDWVNGEAIFGLLIKSADESVTGSYKAFGSLENSTTSYRPTLQPSPSTTHSRQQAKNRWRLWGSITRLLAQQLFLRHFHQGFSLVIY
ncbi:DNRLRE domain-containing protein [Brevibacillus nitrificans]|uniref:DNRLRE domain-containing protein n=1 Tax=Brevibacillus nitrificans TaxID=651560 RepID=UPI0026054501|nr:DNRLRE domain-containing protein [Brevibacillus nitrificans]MED1795010.1 DNRLRE domain-containing protein [Brevibacillus nitrificans]